MTETDLKNLAEALVNELAAAGKSVATAESCTGGWVAKALTDIPGSSRVFAYGIVSYSNGAKESVLGVINATLAEHGAVSEAVVKEMAEGVLQLSGADISVAVSGVAGPDGGSPEKPVGMVWFAWARRGKSGCDVFAECRRFDGDRWQVRLQSVAAALQGVLERLRQYA
ncbi:CinA family protein [Woeseia oceani]|uniref:Damage-inducible protein CinA n=1 Tax=Woeseia oceani TaxID=1548547 RepID=A0A193LI21_9GAMM|nr:CinA family protein [Woeseia oceani]ANO52152.1 damage-inducible protein CinA [Woeseia oceani]